MDDRSVVGLDLISGREVSVIDEGDVPYWRRRGHGGDATVVCLYCFTGADGPGACQVPVVARGRVGGQRRPHFAHPPGMAPRHGRYHPETVWHAVGKQRLADWARRQPGVADAYVEAWTCDRVRRSDVQVHLHDGRRVALELQTRWVTDDEWLARHDDYTRHQIVDVWLWHPRIGPPGIVADRGQPGWLLAEDHSELSVLAARGHDRHPRWWDCVQLVSYGRHWPPCPGDLTRAVPVAWNEVHLSRDGLAPAPEVIGRWHQATRDAAARAAHDHSTAGTGAHAAASAAAGDAACMMAGACDPASGTAAQRPASSFAALRRQTLGRGRGTPASGRMAPTVVRIDAQPPHRDVPHRRRYYCRACDTDLGETDRWRHDPCR